MQRRRQSSGIANAGLPGPCLQRLRDGKPARGVTALEFFDIMEGIKRVMAEVLSDPLGRQQWIKATGGTPEECPPIYSFDNPSIHTDFVVLFTLGLVDDEGKPANRLVLPPHSPDLHRTIERVHARICKRFQDWLYDVPNICEMQDYCSKLQSIFYETQLKDVIQACMSDISDLYERVVELKGAVPEHCFR